MPLWGANTTNQKAPQWLNGEDKATTFATTEGWVHRHDKGGGRFWDEVLCTAQSLSATFANADVTSVFFSNNATAYVRNSATAYVSVGFNEKVTVTGNPQVRVDGSTTNATATYASGSGSNILNFVFTVPNVAQTLSLTAQTVALNSGTIPSSNLAFTTAEVKNVQSKNTGVKTVAVA